MEKNISGMVWGDANTCFHELFLYSIWVIKLQVRIINIGRRKTDNACHPWIKCRVHGLSFNATVKWSGLKEYINRNMKGRKAAPNTLSQKAELRLALMLSACMDISKLTGDYS